jgi:cyclase
MVRTTTRGDGNIGNWPDVTAAALDLGVAHVLPGHGSAGGKEILEGQGRFMTELHKAVLKQGKKLDDVVKKDGKKFTARIWVGDEFGTQVQDAYQEITQGKPVGAIPHK